MISCTQIQHSKVRLKLRLQSIQILEICSLLLSKWPAWVSRRTNIDLPVVQRKQTSVKFLIRSVLQLWQEKTQKFFCQTSTSCMFRSKIHLAAGSTTCHIRVKTSHQSLNNNSPALILNKKQKKQQKKLSAGNTILHTENRKYFLFCRLQRHTTCLSSCL